MNEGSKRATEAIGQALAMAFILCMVAVITAGVCVVLRWLVVGS